MDDISESEAEAFDHHSVRFSRNWEAIYAAHRATSDIIRSPCHEGFWVLTRYKDVQRALLDHNTFSSARLEHVRSKEARGVTIPPTGTRIGFMEMDPPRSTELRRILAPWFSPQTVNHNRDRIRQISAWVLDGVLTKDECDVVTELAQPIPTLLILDILGLPLERWHRYSEILHAGVVRADGSLAGLEWLKGDLITMANDPKGCGVAEGLFVALLNVEIAGERLALNLIVELIMMLLFGGTDTTISTISSLMLHLSRNPELVTALRNEPPLIVATVEEVFRLYSPATSTSRTVTKPVTFAEIEMQPGDRVMCALGSANRDERAFDAADQFDPAAERRAHIAFGRGIHSCLGQHLARADTQIFLEELLTRMPEFTVLEDSIEASADRALVNGYQRMRVRYVRSLALHEPRDAFPKLVGRPYTAV